MFGGRRNNNNNDGSLSSVVTPENPAKKGGSITGFDPEGLERAAKAARDLDASRNASSAIELIKTQEVTKQVRVTDYVLIETLVWCDNSFSMLDRWGAP
jgi:ATPase family AAA domain-containing protein 3A/B